MTKLKAWLDIKLAKFISRTLMVFICASGFFWMDKLGEDNWMIIAVTYIGTQKAYDIFVRVKEISAGMLEQSKRNFSWYT